MALRTGRLGCSPGSVPKLMLIASAPWSVAQTIAAATLESVKSERITSSRQRRPAPARPMPLLPAPQASEATWVPWPTGSLVAGPARSKLCAPAIRSASSGWVVSMPVSMIATVAPAPVRDVPRGREAAAPRPPLDRRAGRGARRGLGRREGRVVGLEADPCAVLGLDAGHARIGAQRAGQGGRAAAAPRAQRDEADPGHRPAGASRRRWPPRPPRRRARARAPHPA